VKEENRYVNPNSMSNVIAARKLEEMGEEFMPGMKVSWIVTDSKKSPMEVEPYVSGRPFDKRPDWEYYARRVAQTLAYITEVYGWDEKALFTGTQPAQQKSLDSGDFPEHAPASEDTAGRRRNSRSKISSEVRLGCQRRPLPVLRVGRVRSRARRARQSVLSELRTSGGLQVRRRRIEASGTLEGVRDGPSDLPRGRGGRRDRRSDHTTDAPPSSRRLPRPHRRVRDSAGRERHELRPTDRAARGEDSVRRRPRTRCECRPAPGGLPPTRSARDRPHRRCTPHGRDRRAVVDRRRTGPDHVARCERRTAPPGCPSENSETSRSSPPRRLLVDATTHGSSDRPPIVAGSTRGGRHVVGHVHGPFRLAAG